MKITMNVNDDLLKRIDTYAKSHYLTRTAVFCFATSQFLTAEALPSLMMNMNQAMQKIAETGNVDEETQRQLDEFDLFVKSLKEVK